jgi:photosystem II stability/assembly factor-like uncharacterized protein
MHEALEVEQPDPGMRSRILSSLPAGDRPGRARKGGITPLGRRTELVAGIATLLLAAIVIGSFAYIRSFSRTHNVSPPPRHGPTLTQPLIVDPATPVILFSDGGQVDGMTWDGRAGKLTDVPGSSSNPGGTLYIAFPNILDRSGRVVAKLEGSPYTDGGVGMVFYGTWADDNQHYCQVLPIFGGASSAPGTLQLTTPGGTPRDVVQVGMQSSGANTLTAAVCSVLADRAVVVQADPNAPGGSDPVIQYWVVQLSTGSILWTHDLRGRGVAALVASRDGRYFAEVKQAYAGGSALPAADTTIYGASGSAAGHVDGWVQGFSWDGTRAIVVADQGRASVVRWSDGSVLWRMPADDRLTAFQAQPGGTGVAIQTLNSILYVISSEGRVVAELQGISTALLACTRGCVSGPGSDGMQAVPRVMVGSVGWSDYLQRTTDGGLNWRNVSPPSPPNRTKGAVTNYILDVDHAWFTVATADVPLRNATKLVVFATADGGKTWTQGSVPMSGVVASSAALGFIDAKRGWLITDSGRMAIDKTNTSIVNQPLTRAIYATSDGGASWSRLVSAQEGDGSTLGTLALGCSISGLTFATADRGWLTWDCNSTLGTRDPVGHSIVAMTQDGGRGWQPVALPSIPYYGSICGAFPPVFKLSQGVLPVLCTGTGQPGFGAVYGTTDGGRSWSVHELPFFTQKLDFVDSNTGWAFGTRGTFGSTGLTLYRTTNGGRDWAVIKQFATEQNLIGFRFIDPKIGFLLTSRYAPDRRSGTSTMWKTTDGGQTWSVLSSRPTGPPF